MNLLLLNSFVFIITNACLNHAVVIAETQVEEGEQESEELEKSLLRKSRDDYSNGFVDILNFFASINKTIADMREKIQNLEATVNPQIVNLQTDVAKINSRIESRVRNSTPEILDVEKTTNNNNHSNFQISSKTLTAKLAAKFWALPLQNGKSFNGSSLSEIISRVSSAGDEGRYTAVVFANYLDEQINNFTIYEEYNAIFNPAPTSIPAHTEEVFTFYEPSCCHVYASFSYVIPSNGVQIAAISQEGALGAGLAFVSSAVDMKTYYDSGKGINGSSVYECCDHVNRGISVGYQNLHARLFARAEGEHKATLRIELIKLS